MTIDKAIEILTERLTIPFIGKNPDTKNAIKLSIEALKTIKSFRKYHPNVTFPLLPGEITE